MPDTKLLEERVTLRTVLAALVVLIVSILLLYVGSESSWWKGREVWQTLLQQVGSSLFTLAGLTFLWELVAKRAFLDEMLAKTKIAKDLLYSGVVQITDSFHEEVDWVALFNDASKIDIFFAYGATWRNRHNQKLKDFVSREKSRLRIVLPDLNEPQTTAELAKRFNVQQATLIGYISEAEQFFLSLRACCGSESVVELWRYPGSPLFSLYRFDNSMVVTTYTHRRSRCPIPTFVCKNTGTLFEFLYNEFQAMIAGDHPLAAKRNDG
jgi:hypothetical protein